VRTVRQMLDALAAGDLNVRQVAQDFETRKWAPSDNGANGPTFGEPDPPADNSFDVVSLDGRLSAADYRTLAAAYRRAVS